MTEREKMLEKLKKLFALGKSENQHEAELAMQKASEIMEQYQINASEVDLQEAGHISREDFVGGDGSGVKHWVYVIARASARLYDGNCAYTRGVKGGLHFIGTKTDIEAMKMTFRHLYDSWKSIVESDLRARKDAWRVEWKLAGCPPQCVWGPGETMTYKQGHGVGYSEAIMTRVAVIALQRHKNVQAKSVTGNSLVLVKDHAIKSYMKASGYSSSTSQASRGDESGRNAGQAAGNSIPLNGLEHRQNHLIGTG